MCRKIILYLLLAILATIPDVIYAADYSDPASVPNPMRAGQMYVCDPDGYLSDEQQRNLNNTLTLLEQQGTVEMAVVVLGSIGDADPVQYAVDLGTLWGVGKKSNSNGAILLVAMESHNIALQVGYGLEGVLPDVVCNDIVDNDMVPLMRNDKLFDALTVAVGKVQRIVSDPAVAAEVKGEVTDRLKEKTAENEQLFYMLATFFVLVMLSLTLWYYLRALRRSRGLRNDWDARSKAWRDSLKKMLCFGLLSLGLGLPFAALAYLHYRRWRMRRRKCVHCGKKMRRLNEAQDNEYLNTQQNLEEQLGSVDYDVWLCPDCGEVQCYAFENMRTKYEKCPKCGTKAYYVSNERVMKIPGKRGGSMVVRTRMCKHCGFSHSENIDISHTDDDSGLGGLIAGAAIGSMLNRGGSGGSSIGGGWGGGSFGGGGASGSW